ncbi:MAG TPA: hypothetical protein VF800_27785 [Telluria sp.]|jgi:hypothetical protein
MKKNEPEMFIVEGRILALRKANGTLNLVEDIQKGAWFTGLAAGLEGQAGMLANAASLALYEGEDIQHIALLINNKLAIGTFEWVEDLKIDDAVKLVVSQIENGPLFIYAILRENDQLLWMPYSVARTKRDWMMHGVRLSAAIIAGSMLIFAAFFIFRNAPFPAYRHLISLATSLILVTAFVGFMSTRGITSLGQQAEDIYFTLGVALPEKFRLGPFSLMELISVTAPDFSKQGYIFKFNDALKAHKKKYRLD